MSNNAKVKAILVSSIDLKEVIFPRGTEIDLDPETMIGYNKGVHFFVAKDEFKILYLN